MVKYSYELKQQIIQDYLDGIGGIKYWPKSIIYRQSQLFYSS